MNKQIFFAALTAVLYTLQVHAQEFLPNSSTSPLSFSQMQRSFNDWEKSIDLKKTKHWKYYKRWETDMQRLTNSNGDLADPAIYINELLSSANKKEALSRSMASWYPVGPDVVPVNETGYMENGIGRINCIAFHPFDTSTFFVGVAQGGVWKTTDDGQSWIPLTDNLPITRVSDITIDPVNPDVMYISLCDFEYIGISLALNGRKRNTHYGLGVYKTVDGGATWQPTALSFQLTDGDASLIRKVLIHKNNSNNLIACGTSGMYTSADGGASWTKKLDSLFWDMVQDPVDPNTLYAATGWIKSANDGYAAIYKSIDFGNTWTMLNTGIPGTGTVQRVKIAIAPSDNNYLYAITVNTSSGLYMIYRSVDAGVNWVAVNPGANILEYGDGSGAGGQGNYDLALLVDASDKNKVYTGGVNIWCSADGCASFNPVTHWTTNYGATIHCDIHMIEQDPVTKRFYVCNDGGVYRTTEMIPHSWSVASLQNPWPTTWSNLSNGMGVTSFYRLSSSKNSSGKLVAGSQDNATLYFDGATWKTIFGGDGMDCFIDPSADNRIIGSSQYGNFYLSENDGQSYFGIDANPNFEQAEWTTPLIADPHNSQVLYAGYYNVTMSTDGGYSWWPISNFFPDSYENELSALAVSTSDPNTIYAARRVRYEYGLPGNLYRTSDGGGTWTEVTSGLPDSLYFTSVEVSETDANTVYVTMAGFSAGNKVFKSTNGGVTWMNISYNLPNIPVNVVKPLKGSNDIIIGTDIGVYVLRAGDTSWENVSLGLPNVIVSDVEINEILNKVYVSTFGRGLWAADLNLLVSNNSVEASAGGFELFPSLNSGTFTIEVKKDKAQATPIQIININGRVVSEQLLANGKNNIKLDLPAGMYFVRAYGKAVQGVRKFVVD